MTRVSVLGAGVVGRTYAGLLAAAGHDVSLVARGARLDELRATGVVLETGGRTTRPPVTVVADSAEARPADVFVVAVRGDHLASVRADAADTDAPTVVCLANPLGEREDFAEAVGRTRVVFAFSGIGGDVTDDGAVRYHVVRQQPTVVDITAYRGPLVADLMEGTGLPVRREPDMVAWLDTHTVFIAGIGSACLRDGGSEAVARSFSRARELVLAMSDGFDGLERGGTTITPGALRAIFGKVPSPFAALYWKRQFAGPVVRVSIEPHVLATRESEFPCVVAHALGLVGEGTPRYRQLLG